jgi:electron transfer flavoprotein beta subunit
MHIVVCLKQILDPEIPADAFELDERRLKPVVVGVPAAMVMDSYAENALETAVQLRDKTAGSRVTAVCVCGADADDVLRRAYAFTVDAAVRVWDPEWSDLDGLAVAHILARAVGLLDPVDLVLCGREAGDIEEGIVGPALAEELGWPSVTLARQIEHSEQCGRVEREVDGLIATLEVQLPAVVSITSSEANVPRMLKVKDTMLSRMKPIQVHSADDVKVDPARVVPTLCLEYLSLPETREVCEMPEGEDPVAKAVALARRLRETKVL